MIISEQQARLVARYLRDHRSLQQQNHSEPVGRDIVEQAITVAVRAPDPRPERVREAREWLDSGQPDPHALADKLLSRMMCDRIR